MTPRTATPKTIMDDIQMTAAAVRLANRAVVADIECHAVAADRAPDGRRVWDIRPMLDPREQPPEFIDMAREAIDYALAAGLVQALPGQPHLVTIAHGAAS